MAVVLLLAGVLIIASVTSFVDHSVGNKPSGEGKIIKLVIRDMLSTAATLLWVKVDIYSHFSVNPGEILPLIRIITYLDPAFIDAYALGGYLLCEKMKGHVAEGVALLKEGISKNSTTPAVDQLHFELGWQLLFAVHDYEGAMREFYRALRTIKYEEAIYLAKNYLRLFAWSSLIAGYHKRFYDVVMLIDQVYPELNIKNQYLIKKMLPHYSKEKGRFNLAAVELSEFLEENIQPAKDTPADAPESELEFIRNLRSMLEKSSSASPKTEDQDFHHPQHQLADRSPEKIYEDHHDHEEPQALPEDDNTSSEEHHLHCHHHYDHGDVWNKKGSWPVAREGLIAMGIGLACFVLKRKI